MQVWCACADTWSCGSHAHAVRPVADRMLNPGSVGAPGPSGVREAGFMLERVPHVKATPKPERCVRPAPAADAGRPTVHRDGWQRVGARAPDRAGHACRAAVTPASPGAWRVRPRRARGRDAPSHPRPLNAHTRPKVDGRAVIGTQRPSEPARSCSSEGLLRPGTNQVGELRNPVTDSEGSVDQNGEPASWSTRAQRSSRARRWFSAPFTAHCHRLLTNEGVIRCRYHPWACQGAWIDREDLGGRNSSVCHDC